MAFGYPPRKRKKIKIDTSTDQFLDACKKAFINLNWQVVEEAPFILRAETPYSWMSEKDIFTIMIHDKEVFVESRYGGPGGGWDYGKNARNIRCFIRELEKLEGAVLFI